MNKCITCKQFREVKEEPGGTAYLCLLNLDTADPQESLPCWEKGEDSAKEDLKPVYVECGCGFSGIRLTDLEDCICLDLWMTKWNQEGIIKSILKRFKLMWKVFRNGDYFLQEIILEKKDVENLKKYLEDFLKKSDDVS